MPTTLNKPAGLPVFTPHWDEQGDCLLQRLLEDQPWRKEIAWPRSFEGGIAHRLDNATSGAVLAADNLEELAQLRQWFAEHRFVKTYLMHAAKDVPWDANRCDKPIAHDPRKKNRMTVQRGNNTPHRGKWYPAQTQFKRLLGSVWEVEITTGVMHQIRVHAAFLGIPITGDRIYGGGAAPNMVFLLHHAGLRGPDGFHSQPVPLPEWAKTASQAKKK